MENQRSVCFFLPLPSTDSCSAGIRQYRCAPTLKMSDKNLCSMRQIWESIIEEDFYFSHTRKVFFLVSSLVNSKLLIIRIRFSDQELTWPWQHNRPFEIVTDSQSTAYAVSGFSVLLKMTFYLHIDFKNTLFCKSVVICTLQIKSFYPQYLSTFGSSYSECEPHTSSNSVTWELNVQNLMACFRPAESESAF